MASGESVPSHTSRGEAAPTTTRPGVIMGYHAASTLAGQHMVDNLKALEATNPALGRHVVEHGFGGMSSGASGSLREWALSTVSILTAMGDCTDQVQIYTEAALKHGATEEEILATINHASQFAGVPRAVNTQRRIHGLLQAARQFKPPQERIISLGDHETLVREYGGEMQGTPIVLIHALSLDGRMFRDVAPRLASQARVITYDLRGHGHARGAPLTKSLGHLAEDLKLLLDVLSIEKADVYGASYGGAVAQYFTLAHADRTRSLCAMATAAQGHPLLASRATRAEEGHMEELLIEALIRWFLPENIALNKWYVRYARSAVELVRVEEWAAAWRAMAALNCLSRIPEIDVPILVLAGTQDQSALPEYMIPIHEAAKRSMYVELNPGTHMMVMEQPEGVATALLNFRQQVDNGQL
ncbi:Alpha/Beta hydrolase protein [Mariannaea sp. PMI_226]|nr:Alpha/Beta hydrolase protein [Mariannaea sp. PMI_226]